MINYNGKNISFKQIYGNKTNYLTHSIYQYPAKFIPQVVKFCIDNYTNKGDTLLDCFAGSGTVALEGYINERNSYNYDLNILLEIIEQIKFYNGSLDKHILDKYLIEVIKQTDKQFIPDYKNIYHWYPYEIFDLISRYWFNIHSFDENIYKWIIQSSMVKISKKYSYADDSFKLFRSKMKIKFIDDLINNTHSINQVIFNDLVYSINKTFDKINSLIEYMKNKEKMFIECFAGVDSSVFQLNKEVDCLITSPPYMQSQEYIRSVKLDLFWLGYSEKVIKKITKLEIPYKKQSNELIETNLINLYRSKLTDKRLIKIYNSYFELLIKSLNNAISNVKKNGSICLFVGSPKINNIEMPIYQILIEYYLNNGLKLKDLFIDEIKTRKLFKNRNNNNAEGLKYEYLIVLEK
jgi:DNA modification methylase